MKTKKVILITGCSSGIGEALAKAFHAQGDLVYATARHMESLASLKESGIKTLELDVNNMTHAQAVIASIEKEHTHLDMLINNAGYAAMGPLIELSLQDLRQQFETNVFAPIQLAQLALPLLRASNKSGLIVNMGSISGLLVSPFSGAYCASKSALHALSDALRLELRPFGIRVITVQPGAIRSKFGETASRGVLHRVTNSLYAPIEGAIHARANASQEHPTSTSVFATALVRALSKTNPRTTIRLGRGSFLFPWLKRWIPNIWLDQILSLKFKLFRLK